MRLRYLDHWTFSARRSSCTELSKGHGTSKKARKANEWQMGEQIQRTVPLLADQRDGLSRTPVDVQTLGLQSFSFTLRKLAPKGLQSLYQQRCCNCGSKGKMSKIESQSRRHKISQAGEIDGRTFGSHPGLADWYCTAGDHHIVMTCLCTKVTFEPLSLHPWWCNNILIWAS